MKQLIISAFFFCLLTACNSSSDTKSNQTDTMNHDHMDHTAATVEMPPMPEVPADAKIFFANLKEGQTVKSPIKIEMGVMGMSVDTANGILKPASGHHHILIGMDSIATETVIPKDSVHLHFGNAQKTAEVYLSPGKHTLTLQFADALHRSYGSRLATKVTVIVKE